MGDCSHSLLWVAEFMHPPLVIEAGDRFNHLAARQLLDYFLQQRIFLPDDLIEVGRLHTRLLQLLEWLSGFDALMLTRVADEDHAVFGPHSLQKFVNLLRACEARFIDEVKPASPGAAR